MSTSKNTGSQLADRSNNKSRRLRQSQQTKFLNALATTKTVGAAASKAKISRQTHRDWLLNDPMYRSRCREVEQDLADEIEEIVLGRALHGTEMPIVRKGEITYVRKPDNRLLELVWRVKRPDLFRNEGPTSEKPFDQLTAAEKERMNNFTDDELAKFNAANDLIYDLLGLDKDDSSNGGKK